MCIAHVCVAFIDSQVSDNVFLNGQLARVDLSSTVYVQLATWTILNIKVLSVVVNLHTFRSRFKSDSELCEFRTIGQTMSKTLDVIHLDNFYTNVVQYREIKNYCKKYLNEMLIA